MTFVTPVNVFHPDDGGECFYYQRKRDYAVQGPWTADVVFSSLSESKVIEFVERRFGPGTWEWERKQHD